MLGTPGSCSATRPVLPEHLKDAAARSFLCRGALGRVLPALKTCAGSRAVGAGLCPGITWGSAVMCRRESAADTSSARGTMCTGQANGEPVLGERARVEAAG